MDGPSWPEELLQIEATLTALLAPAAGRDVERWGRLVADALGALTGARGTVVVLQCGRAVRAFGDGVSETALRHVLLPPGAPTLPGGDRLAPRSRAWCRQAPDGGDAGTFAHEPPADDVTDGRLYHAVGLTAELGPPGVFAGAACHFARPRAAAETRKLLLLLRVLLPAFAAAARSRIFAGASHRLATRLLDAAGANALLCAPDGTVLHETPSLRRTLGADDDGRRLREEMRQAAHAFARGHSAHEGILDDGAAGRDGDGAFERAEAADAPELADVTRQRTRDASRYVRTRIGRYVIRCYEVTPEAACGTERAVAVTVERATGRRDSLVTAVASLADQYGLTDRELEVTRLLSAGRSNADVAQQLGISEHTARRHTERVLSKLGARSRAEVPGLLLGHAAPRLAVDA